LPTNENEKGAALLQPLYCMVGPLGLEPRTKGL
jgi:hypothetical protein